MNKIVLIRNGFDLAHDLKTRYNDFILWYLCKILPSIITKPSFEDTLIKTTNTKPKTTYSMITTIKEFRNLPKEYPDLVIEYKYSFFEGLIKQFGKSNWVDLESPYYSQLLILYRKLEKANLDSNSFITSELEKLNVCFETLKQLLIEYLQTINAHEIELNEDIKNHFITHIKRRSNVIDHEILFLTFNYTSTLEAYTDKLFELGTYTINYIHGQLQGNNNPIIFGYGDEMDLYYQKIERLNNNEFLKYIKSFSYFKTNNYQDFSRFLDLGVFSVYIMGHSCGISDRILLNSIFEHINCREIRIFYHKKSETENDFFEKTQEISRHFKANRKADMRKMIVPFSNCTPLTN